MKKIKRKDLMPFCETSELRPRLTEPFRQYGYVCATDGHILIRVPEGRVERIGKVAILPPTGGQNVDTQKVMPLPAPKIVETVTPEKIAQAISKAPIIDEHYICEACQGMGKVYWEYSYGGERWERWDECPVCDGTCKGEATGNKTPDPDYCYCFCGHILTYRETDRLRHALLACHISDAYIRETAARTALFLTADDIQILVMPVFDIREVKHKITVV